MRMFEWKPDMVRFMRDASEHTDYYEKLADCIVQAAGGAQRAAAMRVCDAGCGLGYLSLALAGRFAHVTAVDIAGEPLSVLRDNAARRGIGNLTVRQADMWSLGGEAHFDAMIFCMFGAVEKALEIARGNADQIIMIKKNAAARCFALGEGERAVDTVEESAGVLKCLGDRCDIRPVTLRLDQPIRSVEDGIRFFTLYGRRHDAAQVTREEALMRMQATGGAEFPFVIPAQRHLSLIRITPQICA